MIELSRHIEILLLDNDCVIVPGLGGFMTYYSTAQFVDNEELFSPPSRNVGFNSQLQLNDSLLVQSYIDAYDLSYPEAIRKINSEVEEIKHHIVVDGEFDFSGIGVLKQVSDGQFDFHPSEAGLLTPSLYALSSFNIGEILQTNPAIKVPIDPIQSVSDVHFSVLKTVAMVATILLLFILCCIPVRMGNDSIQQCSVIDPSVISKIIDSRDDVKLSLCSNSSGLQGKNSDRTKVANEDTQPAITSQQKAQKVLTHYYALVVAAKVSRSGAINLVSKLRKSGFVDANIHELTSNRKVIYGHYCSKTEALNALQKLRNQDIAFTDAWICQI